MIPILGTSKLTGNDRPRTEPTTAVSPERRDVPVEGGVVDVASPTARSCARWAAEGGGEAGWCWLAVATTARITAAVVNAAATAAAMRRPRWWSCEVFTTTPI